MAMASGPQATSPIGDASTEPQVGPPVPRIPNREKSSEEERMQREMERERRKERWREIKRDSEHLLEVATELKQYVDKSGENVMSLEVMKKAAEMEKLSKELQKKMKGE